MKEIPDYLKQAAEKMFPVKEHLIRDIQTESGFVRVDPNKESRDIWISGATSPEAARYHQSPVAERDERPVWVRGSKGLPGLFTKVKWRNADGGNIPLGEATPLEHYQRAGANIEWHEWLSETPAHEETLLTSEQKKEVWKRLENSLKGKDAVAFAEWVLENCDDVYDENKNGFVWEHPDYKETFTTEQLYSLYTKQKQP